MIIRKSPAELEIMARSCKIIADMHEKVRDAVRPGISTGELDQLAEEYILAQNAIPAFKGYSEPPFPGTLCTSVNEEIVHGIPSPERKLAEGDLIKIDAGCILEGYYSDSAATWIVGGDDTVDQDVRDLVTRTREGLWTGIVAAQMNKRVGDVSAAVGAVADRYGYGNVREYTGHGVGQSLHEQPPVPNYGRPGRGPKLAEGLVIAIEPMFNIGGDETEQLDDQWTVATADKTLSAHWEHTIAITPDGPWVLTARSDEPSFPLAEPEKIPVPLG